MKKFLPLDWENPLQRHGQGTAWLGGSSSESALGVWLVVSWLWGQQWALAPKGGNAILGCTNSSRASGAGEAIVPLYSALTSPHLDYRIQFGGLYMTKMLINCKSSVEATKLVTGLEHLLCEETLMELGLFSLKK